MFKDIEFVSSLTSRLEAYGQSTDRGNLERRGFSDVTSDSELYVLDNNCTLVGKLLEIGLQG